MFKIFRKVLSRGQRLDFLIATRKTYTEALSVVERATLARNSSGLYIAHPVSAPAAQQPVSTEKN